MKQSGRILSDSYIMQNTNNMKLLCSREDFLLQPKTWTSWTGCKVQWCVLVILTALVYTDLSQLSKWDIIPGLFSRSCHLTAVTLQIALLKQVQNEQIELWFTSLQNWSTQKSCLLKIVSSESWKAMKTLQFFHKEIPSASILCGGQGSPAGSQTWSDI